MNIGAYLRDRPSHDLSLLSRSSDLFLALLIVAIIALMIMPLPSIMIDSLVAVNIVVGVMLVLMGHLYWYRLAIFSISKRAADHYALSARIVGGHHANDSAAR